jgi:hypothetical protein
VCEHTGEGRVLLRDVHTEERSENLFVVVLHGFLTEQGRGNSTCSEEDSGQGEEAIM